MSRSAGAWAKTVRHLRVAVEGHHCYCLCPIHQPVTGSICDGSPLVYGVEFDRQPVLMCRSCGEWWRDHQTAIPGQVADVAGELPQGGVSTGP